jgi:hypothetical protein
MKKKQKTKNKKPNKQTNKQNNVETFPQTNRKIVERSKIDTSYTY